MWNCDSALSPLRGALLNTTAHSSEASLNRRKRISESIYVGGECSGNESDFDALFTNIQKLVKSYASSSTSMNDFYDALLRLLHCHVLPAIQMAVEDLPQVEAVLSKQEVAIKEIDKKILDKNKELERIKKAVNKQQEHFMSYIITHGCKPNAFPVEFAKILHIDIEQECLLSSIHLEDLQDAVQKAKDRVNTEKDLDMSTVIAEKRKLRDKCFDRHKRLLETRELLKDYITNPPVHRKSVTEVLSKSLRNFRNRKSQMLFDDPLHNIYLETHNKLRQVKEENLALMDKKVLMLSVKEALRSTIRDLREGQESVGFDLQRYGGRSTNVLRPSCIPLEWLTIAEQVSAILSNEKHTITRAHHEFCNAIIDQCNAALFEKQLVELSLPEPEKRCSGGSIFYAHVTETGKESYEDKQEFQMRKDLDSFSVTSESSLEISSQSYTSSARDSQSVNSSVRDSNSQSESLSPLNTINACGQSQGTFGCMPRRDSLIQLEGMIGNDDIIIIHDTDKNHLKTAIEKIKQDIKQHFENMTVNLQEELGHNTYTAYKNIWLKYEVHFYERTMPSIVKLYEACYMHMYEQLCRSACELSTSDLDLNGSILAELLLESPVPTPEVFSPVENNDTGQTKVPQSSAQISDDASGNDDGGDGRMLAMNNNNYSGVDKTLFTRGYSDSAGASARVAGCISSINENIKKVTIHYPSYVTVIYNRRTWPLLRSPSYGEDLPQSDEIEYGEDALGIDSDDEDVCQQPPGGTDQMCRASSRFCQRKKVLLKRKFWEMFQMAVQCIRDAVSDNILLLKLQQLTKCLREINDKLSTFQSREFHGVGACSDELIDMLVILLCNCDVKDSSQLYPHIMLMTDLIPPFFEGGPYSFSLVQFTVAFQFIQDRLILQKGVH